MSGFDLMKMRIHLILLLAFPLLTLLVRPVHDQTPSSLSRSGRSDFTFAPASSLAARPIPYRSLTRLAPWRYRLKSVLQVRDAQWNRDGNRRVAPRQNMYHPLIDSPATRAETPPLIARRC